MKKILLFGIFLAAFGLTTTANSSADPSSYIRNNADGSQTLRGHVPSEVKKAAATFRYHADHNINAQIIMPLANQSQLSTLLQNLYDPKSPSFHQFLTPAQFAQQFAPSAIDSTQVQEFLKTRGISVIGQSSSGAVLNVTGSVRAFEHAFGLHINHYQKTDGTLFFAPDADPSIPATLAGKILAVGGLDNLPKYKAHLQKSRKAPKATALAGSGPNGYLSPNDVKTAYNLNSITATGSGQNVALVEFEGYASSDVMFYESYFSLPNVPLQNVLIDGVNGVPNYNGDPDGVDEVTLDIETVAAFAPGSSDIFVYEAPNTTQSWIDEWTKIATDDKAKVISCSWGEAEDQFDNPTLIFDNQVFQQMAAQGQAVFVAAGDNGAYDDGSTLSVDEPASQPFATAVGISALKTNSDGTYNSETASVYGGGGVSAHWYIPSYQTTLASQAVKAAMVSTTLRNVPDVVLTADASTGYAFYIDGFWSGFYGSSIASPIWASFISLVNQGRGTNGPIGSVNSSLYQLAQSSQYANDFHDITTGNNGYYPAEPGFDDATGLGSFNGLNLYNDLVSEYVPPAPTGLTATAGNAQVVLSWNASTGATAYNVQRSTSNGGPYTTIATVTNTTYTDNSVTNGITYYYVVSALNTLIWQSPNSLPVIAKPQPTYTITASAIGNGTISPSGVTTVNPSSTQTYTITPNIGSYIATVTVNGNALTGTLPTSYTFSNVTSNQTISVTFATYTFNITATAGSNGSISPSGITTVVYGATQAYTITPNSGYYIAGITINSTALTGTLPTSYTFSNVTANQAISVTFAPITFTITATAGSNGSISPSGTSTVNDNGSQTYTIKPNSGYKIANVTVNGATLAGTLPTSYTFSKVISNETISVSFATTIYTVTSSSGSGGSISPLGTVTVGSGANQVFTITPNSGYYITSETVNGTKLTGTLPTSYTFSNVTKNQTLNATFAPVTFTITATAGSNGSISPSGTSTVNYGSSKTYTIKPNSGYKIANETVNGTALAGTLPASYTFSSVAFNETISVSFAKVIYTVTSSAGSNGSILPLGAVTVGSGASQAFTIIPNSGNKIASILVNGTALTGTLPTNYTFSNVTANQTISTTFTSVCSTNMYFNTSNNTCACNAGSYYVGPGCSYCPVGQTYNGTSCVPIVCSVNMYFDTTPGTSGYNTCACDAGSYYVGPGCAYCPVGQTYNGTKCVAITCPANMYFDTTAGTPGYNTCQCYSGTYYVGPGCAYCPVGQTSTDGIICSPVACPAGMYFDTTPNTPGYNSCQCIAIGESYNGTKCVPTPCPANMYRDITPGPGYNSCQCYQYTYYVGPGCAYCQEGYTSNDGKTCVPIQCPAKMYFDTTPGTPGYNTCTCVANATYVGPGCACSNYTYWNGSACAYCPEGYASYNGTTCQPVICPGPNMYFDTSNNTCACYSGTVYVGPGCDYTCNAYGCCPSGYVVVTATECCPISAPIYVGNNLCCPTAYPVLCNGYCYPGGTICANNLTPSVKGMVSPAAVPAVKN